MRLQEYAAGQRSRVAAIQQKLDILEKSGLDICVNSTEHGTDIPVHMQLPDSYKSPYRFAIRFYEDRGVSGDLLAKALRGIRTKILDNLPHEEEFETGTE